jgi:hypothetical protein
VDQVLQQHLRRKAEVDAPRDVSNLWKVIEQKLLSLLFVDRAARFGTRDRGRRVPHVRIISWHFLNARAFRNVHFGGPHLDRQ